jgi:hypothetical protein
VSPSTWAVASSSNSTLYAHDSDVPEHDALALCLRTLRKAVAP